MARVIVAAVSLLALASVTEPGGAWAAYVQMGPKLVPVEATDGSGFGDEVAISGDGDTALVSGYEQGIGSGAVWVYTRAGTGWAEQGPPLRPDPAAGASGFGRSIALSADGDTALVGGQDAGEGAIWTFTRTNGAWSQQGDPFQGGSGFALSSDGQAALVGGGGAAGLASLYIPQGGAWVQQGPPLGADLAAAGSSVVNLALSGDGQTALLDVLDSTGSMRTVLPFRRDGAGWTQDGPPLHADDGTVGGLVALDADGRTALVGGSHGLFAGAVWGFDRTASGWTQVGSHLTGSDGTILDGGLALTPDGTRALVGGSGGGLIGSAWLLHHTSAGWVDDFELVPSDGLGNSTPNPQAEFGWSAALTPDASTLLVGAPQDNDEGAAWGFRVASAPLAIPRLRAFAGTTIPIGPIPASVVLDRGTAPTGSMTFRSYGPDGYCTGPPAQTETQPVAGNGTYSAHALTAGVTGRYGLIVSYSGDAHNAPASIGCRDLVFDAVNVSHLAVEVRGSREVGAPLTIAPTLSGGLFTPSGEVTVSVYGASDPLCAKPPLFTRQVTVQFPGQVPVTTYTPDTTGRLTVTGGYGGDGETAPTELGCGSTTVPIGRASSAIAVAGSPPIAVGGAIGAAARVAGFHAGGAIDFSLYGPGDPTCVKRPLATVDAPLTDGVAQSEAFATSATGTYHLAGSYPGDRQNRGVASACGAGSVTVGRAQPTLTAAASTGAGGAVIDTAQLHGAFRPTGIVRFKLFGRRDPHCRGRPAITEIAPLDGDRATTGALYNAAPGRYEFVVSYAGDVHNAVAQTECGANAVRVPPPHRSHRRMRRRHRPRRRRRPLARGGARRAR